MRNKFTTILAALAMATVPLQGVADNFNVGYCFGEKPDAYSIRYADKNVEVSAAIYVTPEYAATIKGAKISDIRLAMYNRVGCTGLNVWVREALDGENLASASETKTTNLTKGWNKYTLDAPYTVGDKGFYLGYTYSQKSTSNFMEVIPGASANSLFVKAPNADWADMSSEGVLCIEGIAEGSLPACSPQLITGNASKTTAVVSPLVEGNIRIGNQGSTTLKGLTVKVGPEGYNNVDIHIDCNLEPGKSAEYPYSMNVDLSRLQGNMLDMKAQIISVDEGEDANLADNSANIGNVRVYTKTYKRHVLIEEFTTEQCGNCPGAAGALHAWLSLPGNTDVEAICHHVGYYTDKFTLPDEENLCGLYNLPAYGGTWAPAFCFDRAAYDSGSGYMAPVVDPGDVGFQYWDEFFESRVNDRRKAYSEAQVVVDFENPGEHDHSLDVTVTIERADENVLNEFPICTIYLIEDNVATTTQSYGGDNYKQQHLTRAYNGAWGEAVEWDGTTATLNHTFTILGNYKRDDLRVVAVLSKFEPQTYRGYTVPKDIEDVAVENVGYRTFTGETGVKGIESEATQLSVKGIYDAQGNLRQGLSNGLNIIVYSDGSSRKVIL